MLAGEPVYFGKDARNHSAFAHLESGNAVGACVNVLCLAIHAGASGGVLQYGKPCSHVAVYKYIVVVPNNSLESKTLRNLGESRRCDAKC